MRNILLLWAAVAAASIGVTATAVVVQQDKPEPHRADSATATTPQPETPEEPSIKNSTPAGNPAFVKNQSCAECHKREYDKWLGSDHDRAMQHAGPDTVLGNFDEAEFTHFGVTSRFFRKDDRFYVRTEGPDGNMADFEIKYTFGVDPLQQYLIEFPGGRMQCLTIAWDTQRNRWFSLYPDEKISHDDPLHWSRRLQNWNVMCADCHTTNLRQGYDFATDTFNTTWSEINVSCQACHGPGQAHLDWARNKKNDRQSKRNDYKLLIDFKGNGPHYQVDQCARCHSRRRQITPNDQHARPFLDDFLPELLREDLYHADGQILGEVYVHGSFIQSKMYHQGVTCTDCHDPHSLKLKTPGNKACVVCHMGSSPERFPDLKPKNYDTRDHHFHKPGTDGAQCVNCHMPASTYMEVDPRRDHSIRIPRPDLSVKLGTPNACNACHHDQSAQWAADAVKKWYGPGRRLDAHFAEVIAAGRGADPDAAPALIELARNSEKPAIARATALALLQQYGPSGVGAMLESIRDPDPLMRTTAVRLLEGLPTEAKLEVLGPMLKDPIRAVRLEAARVLTAVPVEQFDPQQREAFDAALNEYLDVQKALADQPEAHMNLGVVYANQGQPDRAERSYKAAIEKDSSFLPARFNLANLYNLTGRNRDAEKVLRDGLRHAPEQGELYYSLGLLLVEEQRLEQAVRSLAKAAELIPDRARIHYNYGLALQHLNRRAEAEMALLEAHRLAPADPETLYALAILYVQQDDWDRAESFAEDLVRLFPDAPGPLQMLREIRSGQARDKSGRR